jgi:tetratricopeptide (TPR) repeat protein/tRNA A-37 threonylcarbamoyl transferase component Bud32
MDETLTIFEGDPHYGKQPLTVWGPFQLLETVGQGGYGEVYRAFDTVLEREVALKLLLPRVSSQEELEREILREARLLARVRHPNVVSVYGVDTFSGRVGFWSDFVRGKTLTSLLALQGPFSPREAVLIGTDLCKALSAVHGAGLLHRDIKASNVMREDGGRILLMDFGLSLEEQAHHQMGGTPVYMAPELFKGGQATVASDIYALGILMYHLLTTKYPLDAPTLPEFSAMHESDRRRSLHDERPDLPEKLVRVVETATNKDPAGRFQSAGQMLSALSESIGPAPGAAPKTASKRVYWWLAAPAVAMACAALWFTIRPPVLAPEAKAHAEYLQAEEYLKKYYLPHSLDRAIAGFENTVAMDPRFALGYSGVCRGDYLKYHDNPAPDLLTAIQDSCAKALGLNKDLAPVHVTLGMLYTAMTKNDLAAQELETALRLDARSAEAHAALADLYDRQGRAGDVAPEIQKAEDLAPGDWRWPHQLGNYYLENGRFADAAAQYKVAAGLTPDNSRVWNNLGIAYRRQSLFPDAKAAFEKAIALDPADNYFANLGIVLEQEGNYPEAVDLYLRATRLNPSNYLNWANLAYVYDRIPGDHDKAVAGYQKAIDLAEEDRKKSPEDAALLSRLGSYYATLNDSGKSLPLLRQAAALEPDNPQVLFRAGEGYELLHQRDAALEWIEKALEKGYSAEALRRNPEMAGLVADRRFRTMAAKVK